MNQTARRVSAAAAAVLLCAACARRPVATGLRYPRVVLVTMDTTRADHLGSYGDAAAATPEIDRLARTGVLFTRDFTPMPTTEPAHASMLTGLYPRSHGLLRNGESVALRHPPSLAAWFARRRCRTASIVGRYGLSPRHLGIPGFDEQIGPDWAQRAWRAPDSYAAFGRWKRRIGEAPFFLWIHFWDPHFPYDPLPEFAVASRGLPRAPHIAHAFLKPGVPLPDAETVREETARYDDEIHTVDHFVGRLVADLAAEPGAGPLLVVVTADHGEELGEIAARERFAFGHSWFLYPREVHVPLIVWTSDGFARGTDDHLIDHTRLFPLITRLAQGRPDWRPPAEPFVVVQRRTVKKIPRPFLAGEDDAVIRGSEEAIFWAHRPPEILPLGGARAAPSEGDSLAALRTDLERWRASVPASPGEGAAGSAERLSVLRSLGYVQ